MFIFGYPIISSGDLGIKGPALRAKGYINNPFFSLSFIPRNRSNQARFRARTGSVCLGSLPALALSCAVTKGKMSTFPYPWSFPGIPFPALYQQIVLISNISCCPQLHQSTTIPPEPLGWELNKLLIPAPSSTGTAPGIQEKLMEFKERLESEGFIPCTSEFLRVTPV